MTVSYIDRATFGVLAPSVTEALKIAFAGGILAGAQSLSHIVAGPLVGGSVAATSSFDTVAVTLGVWALPGAIAWLLWRPARY